MDTDIDWQRELDASFGTAPDEPIGTFVAAGHRAVRRRRAVAVVAGLGAAAVIGGVAWAAGPAGLPGTGEAPVATGSGRDGSIAWRADEPWDAGDLPARFDGQGLQIREGAVVRERVDNLFPGKSSESVALDITYRGEHWWMSLEWEADGSGWSGSGTTPEEGRFESFDDFVVAEMSGGGMGGEPAVGAEQWYGGLVQWAGGEPTPRTGVSVVREIPDPVPTAQDSLGLVLEKDGETTWMLITLADGGSAASYSKESASGWATFEQWLADQVAMTEGRTGPQPVRLGDDGTVAAALPGVEVLDQQSDPDLPDYGTARAGASSAVAVVQWQGRRWFTLVVRVGGRTSVTTVAADKSGGATTLDEFVAFMADKADEGGMR